MKLKSIKFYIKRPDIFLKKLLFKYQVWKHPDEPWLVKGAIRFCESILTKDMLVYEWGSGRSTTWFAERVKKVTSIEYNKEWYEIVTKNIKERGIDNVDLRYIPLEHEKSAPTHENYDPMPNYVTDIEKEPSPDFIIIDGHYRRACVNYAIKNLKAGGYLLIDDTYREPSIEDWGVPRAWNFVHQSGNGFMETSLWRKPRG